MTELDHASILNVLEAHSVRFVVIGGIAAELRDLSLLPTIDLDITPARDEQNLLALADAFDELEAGLLTADEHGTWFPRFPTDNWAQYSTLHLRTVHGPLDIVFAPDGAPNGFDALVGDATRVTVGEAQPLVISVATWIRLKEASGRAKDLEHLDRYSEDHRQADH